MPANSRFRELMKKHAALSESIDRRVEERLSQHPVLEKAADKIFDDMDDRLHQIGTDFDDWGRMFREGSNDEKKEGEETEKVTTFPEKPQGEVG